MSPSRYELRHAKRVVIKLGTGVVARSDGGVAVGRLGALVEQIARLRADGRDVLLVSSGAVGLGAARLGFTRRPDRVVDRQACAAAGQVSLMGFYDELFRQLGMTCAQVLLAEEDFHFRQRFNNLTATLERLLELGVVPIINENDTLSTAELALNKGEVFGDNDRLSALVALYTNADLLCLLTDVAGVFDRPPSESGAVRISEWTPDTQILNGSPSALGRGGMASKVVAAALAKRGGVNAVVAGGDESQVIQRVIDGEDVGTFFGADDAISRRKAWLAFATAPAGELVVNAGARSALEQRGASLLSVGVVSVHGTFQAGDVVRITSEGDEVARGVVARSADALRAEVDSGQRSAPAVHRDLLVLT